MTDPIREINDAALHYWQHSSFTPEQLDDLCSRLDERWMFARVIFDGQQGVSITLSSRTWKRKEGHFPTISDTFKEIARHPLLDGRRGVLIVWLEDGMWEDSQSCSRIAPIFAFGRHIMDQQTLLIPDPAFLNSIGYADMLSELPTWRDVSPWELRRPTIFWRGAATGIGIEGENWVHTQRGRVVLSAKNLNDATKIDAKITRMKHLTEEQQEELIKHGVVGAEVPFHDFFKYRYVVDADGYCCAWRSLFLKLMSGSATLKIQSTYEQWYFRELKPWKNYIPVSPDVSELPELYEWMVHHDDAVQSIVREGQKTMESVTFSRSFEELAYVCAGVLNSLHM